MTATARLHALVGYVLVKIEGLNCERIINYASNNGIRIWDIKRVSYTHVRIKTSFGGYKKLNSAFNDDTKITILHAYGIAAKANRVFARKALFFGCLVTILFTWLLSRFFWSITIIGQQSIDSENIYQYIEALGIDTPTLKKNIDYTEIERKIEVHFDDVFWANFTPNGVHLILEVVEKKSYENRIDNETCSDVVASKDGYITKVLAYRGNKIITENTMVTKDDVIIQGEYIDQKGNYRFYNASGVVYADIWYTGKHTSALFDTVQIRTGNSYDQTYIEIFGVSSNTQKAKAFVLSQTEIKSSKELFGNLAIPIKKVTARVYEIKTIKKRKNERQLRKEIYETAYVKAKQNVNNQDIIDEKVIFIEKDDKIEAIVFLKTNENIARIAIKNNYNISQHNVGKEMDE
jgi:similar to stage IV sporulation protein